MKKQRIIFWACTGLIFLFEGVMPALTFQTELAREGIRHLGYPEYFGTGLLVCKILGVLALVIPAVPARVKEWAYAGFTFNFLFAAYSHARVDGLDNFQTYFPFIVLAVLAGSYFAYHRLRAGTADAGATVTAHEPAAELV